MSKIKFLFLSALLGSWVTGANAQITVDDTPTAADLVTNTLMGSGVVVSNITFVGEASQKGYFNGGTSNIGLPEGVILSSGNVVDCVPPNQPDVGQFGNPGDPDVLATAQSVSSNPQAGNITSTNDAAVLEFDFVPSGNMVSFNFVFASEEYETWINTVYNDAFGFYLTGPNPLGGNYTNENLALVPGTSEPITISTIHPGLNAQYYIGAPVGHSFNGFTVPMEITFEVVCGQTYHFKFAVADCQDDFLDTGVFLEGNSFTSNEIEFDFAFDQIVNDSILVEGCSSLDVDFTLPPDAELTDTTIVYLEFSGAAIQGTDFNELFPGDSLIFLPGANQNSTSITPLADGLTEGIEDLILTIIAFNDCGDSVILEYTFYISDDSFLGGTASDTTMVCLADSSFVWFEVTGGIAPFQYSWSNGETTDGFWEDGFQQGQNEIIVTVTDDCDFEYIDTAIITLAQTLAIDTMIQYPSNACFPSGAVSGTAEGITAITGQPYYNWTGPDTIPGIYSVDGTVLQNISPGWYYFTVEDDVCSVMDSIFVDVEEPPVSQFSASPTSGCEPLTVTFTNSSQNTTDYYWDFGNGNTLNIGDESSQTQVYTFPTTVMLVAFADPNCSDTSYVNIAISVCGCTDPTALNYNPNATVDDGECEFPSPAVIVPNVFTPNGDLNNPLFMLTTENTVRLKLTILNRWGNVMYSADKDLTQFGAIVGWDGTTPSGQEAQEGTYFYEYIATGIKGEVVEGHGFLELVRN